MFEQAMSDSDSDDVARGTLPATHTHMDVHTCKYKTQWTRRHTHTNIRL